MIIVINDSTCIIKIKNHHHNQYQHHHHYHHHQVKLWRLNIVNFLRAQSTNIHQYNRLRVVPHFSSGIVERAKRERAWKSPHARKGDTQRGERKMSVSPFLAWGDFHARSRLARSPIPEEKWGTTRSLSIQSWSSFLSYRAKYFRKQGKTHGEELSN